MSLGIGYGFVAVRVVCSADLFALVDILGIEIQLLAYDFQILLPAYFSPSSGYRPRIAGSLSQATEKAGVLSFVAK